MFPATGPPTGQFLKVNAETTLGPNQINNFQKQLMQLMDPIQGKIDAVETKLKKVFESRELDCKSVDTELSSRFNAARAEMPKIQETVVDVSRRVQAAVLANQTATTLAVSKQVKPIQDEFVSLKEDFDMSLRNIATLVKKLNGKMNRKNRQIAKSSDIPSGLEKMRNEMEHLKQLCKRNQQRLHEIQDETEQKIAHIGGKLQCEFEQELEEAEQLIERLDCESEEGLNKSNTTVSKFQSQKFDIRTSFDDIMDEMGRLMRDELEAMHQKIVKTEEKSMDAINRIEKKVSADLEDIVQECRSESTSSMLDEIDAANELNEVESLLFELKLLQKSVENVAKGAQNEQLIHDKDEEDDYEIFLALDDTGTKRFKCYDDGHFEVL